MTSDFDYERKRIEVMQARKASTTLPEHEQILFNYLRSVTRSMLYLDRTFLVWTMGPKNLLLDVLKVNDIDVGFHDGFAVQIKNSMEDKIWVSHTPTRLFSFDAMAHIPYIPDVKYIARPNSKTGKNELQLPIVVKTAGVPLSGAKDVQYVTDVKTFLTYNPEHNGRQF